MRGLLMGAAGAALLMAAAPSPAAAQPGALAGLASAQSASTELTFGQTLTGRAQNGRAVLTFTGEAGQRVNLEVTADSARGVRVLIMNPARGMLGGQSVLASATGANPIAAAVLPETGSYTVTLLDDAALMPRAFNYTLTLSGENARRVLEFGDGAPAQGAETAVRAPSGSERSAVAVFTPASAPTPQPTVAASPVPAHCRQRACWGGMDLNVGRTYSVFDVTIPKTTRVWFDWVEPGRVLRMTMDAYDIENTDLRLNPETGVPQGYTVLADGALAVDAPPTEGAERRVYRFIGEEFEISVDTYRNGQWRPKRFLGVRVRQAWRSEEAVRQAREARAQMFDTLVQGAAIIAPAVIQAQAEVNAQNAELERLRLLAEQETRDRQAREAAGGSSQPQLQRPAPQPPASQLAPVQRPAPVPSMPSMSGGGSGQQGGDARTGYYSCNAHDSANDVTYWSQIFTRPYADGPSLYPSLEQDFLAYLRRRYPGQFTNAGCWSRLTQAQAQQVINSGKQDASRNYRDRRQVDDREWSPSQ